MTARRVVAVAVFQLLLIPALAAAQVSRFQGSWFGPPTDSTAGPMIRVDGQVVRAQASAR